MVDSMTQPKAFELLENLIKPGNPIRWMLSADEVEAICYVMDDMPQEIHQRAFNQGYDAYLDQK